MKYHRHLILLIVIFSCILGTKGIEFDDSSEDDDAEEVDIVIEGDILETIYLYKDESQSASVHLHRTWPNATIPYRIANNYNSSQVEEIKIAMEALENKTCIKFTERKNDETSYINIVKYKEYNNGAKRSGCISSVGRLGKRQYVILDDFCLESPGTVKHELTHVVGFAHEQSRLDRDDYVTIHYDNIKKGEKENFDKKDSALIRSLNTTYDLKSLMQYEWNASAIDPTKPTITAKDGSIIERPVDFSRTDILDINRLYKCKGEYKWGTSDNDQVQQAKNCSFFGIDIHHQQCSSEECTALCLANSHCTHFTWDSEDNCYLTTNSSFIDIYPQKGSLCGYITQRNSKFSWRDWEDGEIKWAPRCDFFGLDFHQQEIGYKECGELCLYRAKCTHFTWEWEGNCYLKTLPKNADIYPYEKSICGYINPRESTIPWQDGENGLIKWAEDCDFFGHDFHQVKSKDKECSGLCLANSKCTHFTWDWEGNCHLKKAPNSTSVYPFRGAVCGYVTQRKATNFIWKDRNNGQIKWAKDCDFFGYNIHEQKSKEEECSGLCLANMNCSHFTWDREGNCYLKNAPKSVSRYRLKGAVCGYISHTSVMRYER